MQELSPKLLNITTSSYESFWTWLKPLISYMMRAYWNRLNYECCGLVISRKGGSFETMFKSMDYLDVQYFKIVIKYKLHIIKSEENWILEETSHGDWVYWRYQEGYKICEGNNNREFKEILQILWRTIDIQY